MHPIGLASTDKLYERKVASLPAGAQEAALWMRAFGEGLAVLAAAGSPEVAPNQYAPPEMQQTWARGMNDFNQDLEVLTEFFLEVIDGRLPGNAANQKA